MAAPAAADPPALAAEIGELMAGIFTPIEELAGLVARCRPARRAVREDELASVGEVVKARLAEDILLVGMGFVAALGAVAGHDNHYLLWWQLRAGKATRLRLNVDPRSPDLYDYTTMPWFAVAQEQRRRVVHGPYVDYSGSDLFTMTISVPVLDRGDFLGVTGVDLHFLELEQRLVRVLRRAGTEACVLDGDRRVIATNTARWVVSSRLREAPVPGSDAVGSVVEVPGDFGWSLLTGSAE